MIIFWGNLWGWYYFVAFFGKHQDFNTLECLSVVHMVDFSCNVHNLLSSHQAHLKGKMNDSKSVTLSES